jgi:predicted transcriptional regulator
MATEPLTKYIPIVQTWKHIHNEWFCHLNLFEQSIVNFIFARTWAFNKYEELIPHKHFISGVKDKNTGKFVTGPTGIFCKKTLIKYLNELEKKGVLSVVRKPKKAGIFSLNVLLTEEFLRSKIENCALTSTKEQPNMWNSSTSSCGTAPHHHVEPRGGHNNKNNKNKKISESHKRFVRSQNEVFKKEESMDEKIKSSLDNLKSEALKKTKTIREKKKLLGGVHAYERIWNDLVRESFPTVPLFTWTPLIQGKFRTLIHGAYSNQDLKDMLEVSIKNWAAIIRSPKIKKMKDVPSYPRIGFFVSYVSHFFDFYYYAKAPENIPAAPTAAEAEKKELKKLRAELAASKNVLKDMEYKLKEEKQRRAATEKQAIALLQEKTRAEKRIKVKPINLSEIPDWDD